MPSLKPSLRYRYRPFVVSAQLSQEECAELDRCTALLGKPVRTILLYGMARAKRIIAKEMKRGRLPLNDKEASL
jgi:hypothetical protein